MSEERLQQVETSDLQRRIEAGEIFYQWLVANRFSCGVVYVGNIEDALPPAVRPALTAHGVPPSAYQGRMVGMSTALIPKFPRTIVLGESLLPQEMKFWEGFWQKLGVNPPTVLNQMPAERNNVFFYPFIGSLNFYQETAHQSLPPAELFNNKAFMRRLLKRVGLGEFIVPGIEIFYNNTPAEDFVNKIYDNLLRHIRNFGVPVLIKLGNTASGLLNIKITPADMFAANGEKGASQILDQIRSMFLSSYDKKLYPGDVIIEQRLDFGNQENGWGDFSLRGFISPIGDFFPFSIGRIISSPSGEYLGMVMVESTSKEQLGKIGLPPQTLIQVVEASQMLAQQMFQQGYFGPFSIDFFALQQPSSSPFLIHDYNMREGGTTISGLISSASKMVFGKKTPVLDIELKAHTKKRLSADDLNEIVRRLQELSVFPYATSFLNYPQVSDSDFVYTLKLLMPYNKSALTDKQVADFIRLAASNLNDVFINNLASIRFSSPL